MSADHLSTDSEIAPRTSSVLVRAGMRGDPDQMKNTASALSSVLDQEIAATPKAIQKGLVTAVDALRLHDDFLLQRIKKMHSDGRNRLVSIILSAYVIEQAWEKYEEETPEDFIDVESLNASFASWEAEVKTDTGDSFRKKVLEIYEDKLFGWTFPSAAQNYEGGILTALFHSRGFLKNLPRTYDEQMLSDNAVIDSQAIREDILSLAKESVLTLLQALASLSGSKMRALLLGTRAIGVPEVTMKNVEQNPFLYYIRVDDKGKKTYEMQPDYIDEDAIAAFALRCPAKLAYSEKGGNVITALYERVRLRWEKEQFPLLFEDGTAFSFQNMQEYLHSFPANVWEFTPTAQREDQG